MFDKKRIKLKLYIINTGESVECGARGDPCLAGYICLYPGINFIPSRTGNICVGDSESRTLDLDLWAHSFPQNLKLISKVSFLRATLKNSVHCVKILIRKKVIMQIEFSTLFLFGM